MEGRLASSAAGAPATARRRRSSRLISDAGSGRVGGVDQAEQRPSRPLRAGPARSATSCKALEQHLPQPMDGAPGELLRELAALSRSSALCSASYTRSSLRARSRACRLSIKPRSNCVGSIPSCVRLIEVARALPARRRTGPARSKRRMRRDRRDPSMSRTWSARNCAARRARSPGRGSTEPSRANPRPLAQSCPALPARLRHARPRHVGEVRGELLGRDRRRSKRWHRDSTVTGTLLTSVVARKNFTCSGGSSRSLEQRIESLLRKHVNFVDDVDLVARADRRVANRVDDLADVVDAGVRRRIHLDHVDVAALGNRAARFADVAGRDRRTALPVRPDAVQRLGDEARGRGLADPANAGQQEGMGNAPALRSRWRASSPSHPGRSARRRSAAGTCGRARGRAKPAAAGAACSGRSRPRCGRFVVVHRLPL